jgi:hypothetical protein
MTTLLVFENTDPEDTTLAGEVSPGSDGRLTVTPRSGSPRAAELIDAVAIAQALPTLRLRVSEGTATATRGHILKFRDVDSSDPSYLQALGDRLFSQHGLRCELPT